MESDPGGRIAESEMPYCRPCLLVHPRDVLPRMRQVPARHGCSSEERLDRGHGGSPRGRAAYGTMSCRGGVWCMVRAVSISEACSVKASVQRSFTFEGVGCQCFRPPPLHYDASRISNRLRERFQVPGHVGLRGWPDQPRVL